MEEKEITHLAPTEVTPPLLGDPPELTLEEELAELQINNHPVVEKEAVEPTMSIFTSAVPSLNPDSGTSNNASVQTDVDEAAFDTLEQEWDYVEMQPGDSQDDEMYYSLPDEYPGIIMPDGEIIGQLPFPGPIDIYNQAFGHGSPTHCLVGEQPTVPIVHYGDWAAQEPLSLSTIQPIGDNLSSHVGGGEPCVVGGELELPLMKPGHNIAIQTDFESRDFGINTEEIEKNLLEAVHGLQSSSLGLFHQMFNVFEEVLHTMYLLIPQEKMMSERMRLKESYQEVLDKQRQVESQLHVQLRQLQQRREEERKNHKEILKGIQDVTIKREESKKKMERERKEFSLNEPELQVEYEKLQEKNKRLLKEQEEKEKKVASLVAEQFGEKELCEEELAELKKQYIEISRSVMEVTERALEAEVMSLESRRELLFLRLREVENEAKMRLTSLRSLPESHEIKLLKQEWEKRLLITLANKDTLQEKFVQHIEMVKNGAKLCMLPELIFPTLPPKPNPRIEANVMLQVAPQLNPSLQQQKIIPVGPSDTMPPKQPAPLSPGSQGLPAGHVLNVPQATSGMPTQGLAAVKSPTSGAQAAPANKLGKILDFLAARYPQCSKSQFTQILQHIKTSRGTTAGLSMDDLCQLVGARLAEMQVNAAGSVQQPLGHIGSLPFSVPQPRISHPVYRPMAQASYTGGIAMSTPTCKLCLMCQKIVQPRDAHPMLCTHVLHTECIRFWAKTNQNESCPFCPASK